MNKSLITHNHNLPSLFDNESIYSWCSYYHLFNGFSHPFITNKYLFNDKHVGLLQDFPAYLNNFTEFTNFGNLSSKDLALKHTLLGYFLPFKTKKVSDFILSKVINGNYPQLKYKLGIPASKIGGNHPLKYCPFCKEEQSNIYGREYWQVEHQYPSSLVCIKHKEALKNVNIDQSPVHMRSWIYPDSKDFQITKNIFNIEQSDHLIKFAQFSKDVASLIPCSLEPKTISWIYQYKLNEIGLVSERGNIRIELLIQKVIIYYECLMEIPEFNFIQSISKNSGGFIGSIVRKKPKSAHPFKHLILMCYLFESWDDFLNTYKKAKDTVPSWHKPASPNVKAKHPSLDEFLRLAKQGKLSLRKIAHIIGISESTATQWAKKNNIEFTNRAKFLYPKKVEQISNLLKVGTDKKTVAQKFNISETSINRILGSDTDLYESWKESRFKSKRLETREFFQKLLIENPGIQLCKLRKIPGNGYMWLYKNDAIWLAQNLPFLNIKK